MSEMVLQQGVGPEEMERIGLRKAIAELQARLAELSRG